MAIAYRNISFATAASFDEILRRGSVMSVRGSETRELRNRLTVIERPYERCVFLPGRRNDIFAQIAETLWVIAGRNDLAWLVGYLPRAPDFSDDGKTWRAAYGPRLRNWAGQIDQFDEWRQLLIADPATRRAVGTLFDPAQDFVRETKDVPCNNWLSWLLRDGHLNLSVAIRSNDAMWGFSGVNAFEWSVLQEVMAFWVGAEIGDATFLATSYHLYDRHYDRAGAIASRFYGVSPYDFGVMSPKFATRWEDFETVLTGWFTAEGILRGNPDGLAPEALVAGDPLLTSALRLVRLKWGALQWSKSRLRDELHSLPEDDFAAAAYEFFGREDPTLLIEIPQLGIRGFFDACRVAKSGDAGELKEALKLLHARKNASYGRSWKRRGERVSVLPNIARKIDRLQAFADEGLSMEGETLLDTAIDLYVYALKYRLLLAEDAGAKTALLPAGSPSPYSDYNENFNALLAQDVLAPEAGLDFQDQVRGLTDQFERLWQAADAGSGIVEREAAAERLASSAERLVSLVIGNNPESLLDFVRQERGHH